MSEVTRSARLDGAPTVSGDSPDVLDREPGGAFGQASPSVRELLAELATLEDATRDLGGVRRPVWTAQTPDFLAALAREQEIIDELHRRCHKAQLTIGSTNDDSEAAAQAD